MKDENKLKKEVIGAYVLFPGSEDAKDVENLYFQKSIQKIFQKNWSFFVIYVRMFFITAGIVQW